MTVLWVHGFTDSSPLLWWIVLQSAWVYYKSVWCSPSICFIACAVYHQGSFRQQMLCGPAISRSRGAISLKIFSSLVYISLFFIHPCRQELHSIFPFYHVIVIVTDCQTPTHSLRQKKSWPMSFRARHVTPPAFLLTKMTGLCLLHPHRGRAVLT